MGTFSIYTDESGQFHKAALGQRVTVAIVLPGTRAECENQIRPVLKEAASDFGLPFHARECRGRDLALEMRRRLRKGVPPTLDVGPEIMDALRMFEMPPQRWLSHLGRKGLMRTFQDLASRILNERVRPAMAEMVKRRGGLIVACLEHGSLGVKRWHPMVDAVVREAIVRIALRDGGPHRAELAIGDSGDPSTTFDFSDLVEQLRKAANSGFLQQVQIHPEPMIKVERADECLGMQVADVFAHAFGPRGMVAAPISSEDAWALSMDRLRTEFNLSFGMRPRAALDAAGALAETHGEMKAAFVDLEASTSARSMLERRLRDLDRRQASAAALPRSTFRCSVQGTAAIVKRLWEGHR